MTITRTFVIVAISLVSLVWGTYAPSFTGACDSCGRECQAACGTKGFRTCCLNYLKKRSALLPTGTEMRLELLMVLPQLAQYYSSLKSFEPRKSRENEYKMLYEKLQTDFDNLEQVKYSEPEQNRQATSPENFLVNFFIKRSNSNGGKHGLH